MGRAADGPPMKHLRVTARVDPDASPAFFDLLARSPAVSEARVLDWNEARDGVMTLLYAIDGDTEPLAAMTETPGIESIALAATGNGRSHALVEARPAAIPTFEAIHRSRARGGLVVRLPIVYRDGAMVFRVVGDPAPLQAGIDEAPEGLDIRVDEIGSLGSGLGRPASALSDRQREAVAVAVDLGYYEQPRTATQADVASELGCVPATAGDHLQRAEAKLARAAIDEFPSPD